LSVNTVKEFLQSTHFFLIAGSLTLSPLHTMKTFLAVLALASAASATFVFPAITLTSGTGTAAVTAGLSATSVAVGAAAIAGLAIAKTALFLAYQADSRRRHRRSTTEIDFAPIFEGIADSDDCGKLLICHSFAKDHAKRTGEEKAIINLFDNLSVIQPNAYGKFQWAAYAGSFKDTAICVQRFSACPVSVEKLSNLISVQ